MPYFPACKRGAKGQGCGVESITLTLFITKHLNCTSQFTITVSVKDSYLPPEKTEKSIISDPSDILLTFHIYLFK